MCDILTMLPEDGIPNNKFETGQTLSKIEYYFFLGCSSFHFHFFGFPGGGALEVNRYDRKVPLLMRRIKDERTPLDT